MPPGYRRGVSKSMASTTTLRADLVFLAFCVALAQAALGGIPTPSLAWQASAQLCRTRVPRWKSDMLLQAARDGTGGGEVGEQAGLDGVVQVRFAGPHRAGGLIVGVELMFPGASLPVN